MFYYSIDVGEVFQVKVLFEYLVRVLIFSKNFMTFALFLAYRKS